MTILVKAQRIAWASRLSAPADLPVSLLHRVREKGLDVCEPIQAFWASFDDSGQGLWREVLLEEARERLGDVGAQVYVTDNGVGETVYVSPLLQRLRAQCRQDGVALEDGAFPQARRHALIQHREDPAVAQALKDAWARAHERCKRQALSSFADVCAQWGVDPLARVSAKQARMLARRFFESKGYEHLKTAAPPAFETFCTTVGDARLAISIDCVMPMNNKVTLSSASDTLHNPLDRNETMAISMERTLFVLMAEGGVLRQPRMLAEFLVSCEVYEAGLQCLKSVLVSDGASTANAP